MAINVSQAFKRTSANPIDESLTLTKTQMVAVNDNLMPGKYLTVCQDDGKIYLYDKSNESDVSTGRFRELQAGSSAIIDPTPTQGSTNAVQSGGTYTALDGKVDKVTGKGLSTEDYTTAEQTKLYGVEAGAEVNAIEGITLNGDTVTPDANRIIALTVITNTVNNLLNYYNKTETYTKAEVDALVSAVAGATFESVSTLPTTDIKTNVIYLVPKQDPQAGDIKDEYINLDGTTSGWEHIGDTQVDLSNYVTKTELNTALADYTNTADLTTLLADKVDKVTGKGLSTNDYTTAEKDKLAGLSNYDDTALSGRVSDIEDVVPSTATTSNKLATMADVGGASGHTIEDSTGVDMTARSNLQFIGASVTDDSTNDRTVVTVDISSKADKVANATNGNFAGLDANGNLADSGKKASDFATTLDLDSKENVFRLSTMPTASAEYANGKSYQYIGSTTSIYTHNYFYECKAQGTDPETYAWEEAPVQAGGGGADSRIGEEITKIGVRQEGVKLIPYIRFKYDVPPFNTLSWGDLGGFLQMYYNGDISIEEIQNAWSLGDSIPISFSDMQAMPNFDDTHSAQTNEMQIVDFNTYNIENTETKCLLTLQMKDCFNEKGKIDIARVPGNTWLNEPRRTWCRDYVYPSLSADVKALIKNVERTTDVVDNIFIPTSKEVMNYLPSGGNPTFGTLYEYYETQANRVKKIDGTIEDYFCANQTGQSSVANATYYPIVTTNGSGTTAGMDSLHGLAIAFCI